GPGDAKYILDLLIYRTQIVKNFVQQKSSGFRVRQALHVTWPEQDVSIKIGALTRCDRLCPAISFEKIRDCYVLRCEKAVVSVIRPKEVVSHRLLMGCVNIVHRGILYIRNVD